MGPTIAVSDYVDGVGLTVGVGIVFIVGHVIGLIVDNDVGFKVGVGVGIMVGPYLSQLYHCTLPPCT